MTLIHSMLETARKQLVTIQGNAPVVKAAKLLTNKNTGLIVVCNDAGHMVGVVTKADVVLQISECTGCSCATKVESVMTQEIICCYPQDRLEGAWNNMRKNRLRQIPVSSPDGLPIGLLYDSDILQTLLREVEHEQLLLRDYVMGLGYC